MLLRKICIFSNCEIRMVYLFVLQSGSGVNSLILLSHSVTGTAHMDMILKCRRKRGREKTFIKDLLFPDIYVMCFNIQINLVIGKYILKMRKLA